MSDSFSPDEQELLSQVPTDGTSIGNKTLRTQLNWDDEKYWAVRNPLVEREVLRLGRGKGGSISRVADDAEDPSPFTIACDETTEDKWPFSEALLYEPIAEVLQDKWSKELKLEEFFIQVTAKQGRRDTGGTWTRPDIVLVNVASYLNLPGKYVDVITFEVKTADGLDVTAVYEALAHLRAATRAYVIVSMNQDERLSKEALIESVADEANRHGIGFIIVPEDVKRWDDWEFYVEATAVQGVPSRLDDFLETQLTEENKKMLRKAIK